MHHHTEYHVHIIDTLHYELQQEQQREKTMRSLAHTILYTALAHTVAAAVHIATQTDTLAAAVLLGTSAGVAISALIALVPKHRTVLDDEDFIRSHNAEVEKTDMRDREKTQRHYDALITIRGDELQSLRKTVQKTAKHVTYTFYTLMACPVLVQFMMLAY